MYRPVTNAQDAVAVPQLVFSKLASPGADDARFRVALHVLAQGGGTAEDVAAALRLPVSKVQRALDFWEGAGLVEREAPAGVPVAPAPRRRLTTAEATRAGEQDKSLGGFVAELQHIFGGVVSQADINIFVTLYTVDGMPPDLILLAAGHCAAQGKPSARYIEKMLLAWRRDGIADATAADGHLRLLAEREEREALVAETLGLPPGSLTLAERKKIAVWFEEYGYGKEMLGAAMLAAGDKAADIRYLHGIFKQWARKGWRTARDVQQRGENRNLRVQGSKAAIAPEDDILLNTTAYVSAERRRAGKGELEL